MMLRNKPICKLYAFGLALLFTVALAGCGGGGGTKKAMDTDPGTGPATGLTDEQMCVNAGGDYADGGCTTAEMIAAKKTKSAGTKVTAIDKEAGQETDAGIGGSTENNVASTYSIKISRGADGTTVAITDTANPDEADPPNPQFMQVKDLGDGITKHDRDNGDGEIEIVMVSTDIQAPTKVDFAKFEEEDGTKPQVLTARDLDADVDADKDGTANNDFTAISVVTANLAQIMAAGFSASGAGALSYTQDDGTTTDKDEAFETAGTYNGAEGTYRCNGTSACSVTYDAKGEIEEVGNGWVFTPNPLAKTYQSDYNYLSYGFWLKKTAQGDGSTKYDKYDEIETFARSSVAATVGIDLNSVEGSADYKGGALGVYVKNVHSSDGKIESATSGHFTADVSLTANFGGTSIAEDIHNTVTGKITGFELAGDEVNSWAVNLKDGVRATGANTFSGDAEGGGASGSFSGTFHGSSAEVDPDDTVQDDEFNPAPGAVVGEFNANFSNGTVAGGFGARKE